MGVKIREKIKGSGKWWIFIDHQGRRKAKYVGSKKAAEKVKEIIEAKLKLGQSVEEESRKNPKEISAIPILDAFFESFKKTLDGSVRETTRKSYIGCYTNHIKSELGLMKIDRITRQKVEEFTSLLVGKGLSKDTIRLIVATLRRTLNRARRLGLISDNPAAALGEFYKQAPVRHVEIQPLTRDEVPKFLEVARRRPLREYALFLCAIHTGMRSGELAGLQWGDLDIRGKFIMVRRSIVRGKVNPTKTGKIRRVDVSDSLLETLFALKKNLKEVLLATGKNELSPDTWIFANSEGNPPDMQNLKNRVFFKLLEKAGLRRIRFHDLRHTYASILIQNGEPLAYVKEQLGHSSIKITVDVYGHLVPGSNRQAVNRLPSIIDCIPAVETSATNK
ncbi:MAG: site-specific integrase [Syntrophaceae bacterium]|nr:site-specific integrase [Syntrophaceae bacterium]